MFYPKGKLPGKDFVVYQLLPLIFSGSRFDRNGEQPTIISC
jgi:hypothetical protein